MNVNKLKAACVDYYDNHNTNLGCNLFKRRQNVRCKMFGVSGNQSGCKVSKLADKRMSLQLQPKHPPKENESYLLLLYSTAISS
jgi:hypothetical protein